MSPKKTVSPVTRAEPMMPFSDDGTGSLVASRALASSRSEPAPSHATDCDRTSGPCRRESACRTSAPWPSRNRRSRPTTTGVAWMTPISTFESLAGNLHFCSSRAGIRLVDRCLAAVVTRADDVGVIHRPIFRILPGACHGRPQDDGQRHAQKPNARRNRSKTSVHFSTLSCQNEMNSSRIGTYLGGTMDSRSNVIRTADSNINGLN